MRIGRGEIDGDENVGLAVADLEFKRVKSVERRIIDHRSARFQNAKEGDHIMGRVGQEEADMHPGLDAELLETGRGAVRKRVELGVGHGLVHELQRGLVTETRRRFLQHALQRRDVEGYVRADALRIGLDPRLNRHCLSSRFLWFFWSGGGRRGGLNLSWRVLTQPSSATRTIVARRG